MSKREEAEAIIDQLTSVIAIYDQIQADIDETREKFKNDPSVQLAMDEHQHRLDIGISNVRIFIAQIKRDFL
jgi:hypothetical protein